ncbi:ribbon-helix-helix domain-containing protein [Nitratifractor sp.]
MHRTQIYFEESMFQLLKERAAQMGISVSAYIREALKKELNSEQKNSQKPDLSEFAGLWKDRDNITTESLREKAWK